MTNSNFVSDAELVDYINGSIAELHDLLIGSDTDYYLLTDTFNTVSGTETYALPAAFYKLRGVDVRSGSGEWASLRPFNFNERNASNDLSNYSISGSYFRYRVAGDNLMFNPPPQGIYNVKVWYTPVATKLSSDADVLKDVNQFSEYVIVDAAIKCLNKEEADVSVLLATKADLRKRIENMSANRDAGQPESISDIYAENLDYFYFTD
jgi:hypothetical protein